MEKKRLDQWPESINVIFYTNIIMMRNNCPRIWLTRHGCVFLLLLICLLSVFVFSPKRASAGKKTTTLQADKTRTLCEITRKMKNPKIVNAVCSITLSIDDIQLP